jgi:hypothetical protein
VAALEPIGAEVNFASLSVSPTTNFQSFPLVYRRRYGRDSALTLTIDGPASCEHLFKAEMAVNDAPPVQEYRVAARRGRINAPARQWTRADGNPLPQDRAPLSTLFLRRRDPGWVLCFRPSTGPALVSCNT